MPEQLASLDLGNFLAIKISYLQNILFGTLTAGKDGYRNNFSAIPRKTTNIVHFPIAASFNLNLLAKNIHIFFIKSFRISMQIFVTLLI